MGRQLDEEADWRAAQARARPSDPLPYSWSSAPRPAGRSAVPMPTPKWCCTAKPGARKIHLNTPAVML